MKPQELLDLLRIAGRLKTTPRHCFFEDNRQESVADHSWRIALMAMMLEDEYKDLDINKVIRMCLIHDLGECFTGDIPTFNKSNADSIKEDELLASWVNTLPNKEYLSSLYEEMNAQETKEAKLYKALDKIEAIMTHNETSLSTWLPLEYDLQLTYGQEQTSSSEYMKELRKLVDEETKEKIKSGK